MAQYTPNHTSLPFLTMLIIHLQAAHPDRKAARKPTISAEVLISAFASDAPFMISIPESNASPKIGGITIRKENCARVSFLLPRISPVAMVLPERESPGLGQSDNEGITLADLFFLPWFGIIRIGK